MTKEQELAVRCAHADLQGLVFRWVDHIDTSEEDAEAATKTINEMINAFKSLNLSTPPNSTG